MFKFKIDPLGNIYWFNDKGQRHREGAPAILYTNGHKEWWVNGKPHREDGPAIEYSYGAKFWYYKGKPIDCNSQEEFLRIIKMKVFW